jgi:hypothetical protein
MQDAGENVTKNEGLRERRIKMTRWDPVQELNLFRFLPDSMFGGYDDVQLAEMEQDESQTKELQE